MDNCEAKAAEGYNCASLSSANSRALVGSMPNSLGGLDMRYVIIGKTAEKDQCSDVCPNHSSLKPGESAIYADAGLIRQLYFQVEANRIREEDLLREKHKLRNPSYRSQENLAR